MWRYCIAFLLLTGACCHAWAQNVVFTATAGANKMGVKDQVQVQYTVRDAQNLQSIAPPASPDFIIVGGPFTSQSTQVNVANGRTVQSQSVSLTYVLQPKHEGTFTIPPVAARDAAGHTFQSNALTIQVVPGSVAQQQRRQPGRYDPFGDEDEDPFAAMRRMQQQMQAIQQQQMQAMRNQAQGQPQQPQQPPQAAQQAPINDEAIKNDLFIKVVVDKSKVHVGEQITTSYKLYSRIPMQMAISKLPSLNGFWTQDFEIPKQAKPTEEIVNGKKYQVFLLKKSALFPQETGTLELDPAEATGMARIIQQVRRRVADADPFGMGTLMMNDPMFNNAFFNTAMYRDIPVHIKSAPVKITVTALPDKGKPADYGGAVGSFAIASKIDKKELTTDDVATLTLNITGSGNLKLIEAPRLSLPNGLSAFDPQITDTITGRSTTITGSRILSYVISAQTPGDYEIPAVPFTYFNAATGEYVTQHTEPFKIHVAPGKHYNPAKAGNSNLALKDIRDIEHGPLGEVHATSRPMIYSAGYWSMYALPMLAFAGILAWRKRDEEQARDTARLRSKRANKVALQRLVTARKLLQAKDKKPFYEEISKAIWLYLSDKLNIPLSALSKETATEAMNSRRVPENIQKSLENVMWECETSLYASGGSREMSHTYEEAIKVISDLEDVFKA